MDEVNLDQSELITDEIEPSNDTLRLLLIGFITFLFVLPVFGFLSWHYLSKPPANFPLNQEFVIEAGSGLKQIARKAKTTGLIKSEYAFLAELKFHKEAESVKAGTYVFNEPLTTKELAESFFAGNPKADLISLTHIEGETIETFANRVKNKLENFSATEFIELNQNNEGYLFPDTYFVTTDFTATELTKLLSDTFTEKTEVLMEESQTHFLNWEEIIILASILEREANSTESKKMVSGILQNRLKLGMALQADATVEYVLDKPLSLLTPEDLEIHSPYNTYLYPGLPPTPIGNPGLAAIEAVIHSTESDYYFYITGNDGNFYYAKNFDEHRLNIARYLR